MRREHSTIRWAALVGVLVIFSFQPAKAGAQRSAEWGLLVAIDSTGRVVEGTKAALLSAVRAGEPIRVGWSVPWRRPDGRSGTLEHVADAAFLTIHHGEVFAQLAPIMRQRPSADSATVQLDTAATWVGMLDTTGRLRGVFPGAGPAPDARLRMRWYAPRKGS